MMLKTLLPIGQLLQTDLALFTGKFVEFCVRYFAVAGGLYCVLEVLFRHRFLPYRVQARFPQLAQVAYEIRWSMSNTACSTLSTVVTFHLVHRGWTNMYFAIGDRGWPYLVFSAITCVVGYDTWLYWEHRWLHTRWLYRHVHHVHHRVGNPTAFATFAHHPVETFMGNLYFVLFTVFVPMHPAGLALAGLLMFPIGIIGHLGYEFYPTWFNRLPILRLVNSATYHNIHHRDLGSNFGAYSIWWDRLMGTAHPGFEHAFANIKAHVENRVAPGAAIA